MNYTFNYKLSDPEYIQFNVDHLLSVPANAKRMMISRLFLPIIFFAIGIAFWIKNNDHYYIIVYLILSVLLFFIYNIISKWEIRRKIAKMIKKGKVQKNEDTILEFDGEYIYEKTETAEMKIKYDALWGVHICENGIYVYNTPVNAFVLPDRLFAGGYMRNEFTEFIKSKIDIKKVTYDKAYRVKAIKS